MEFDLAPLKIKMTIAQMCMVDHSLDEDEDSNTAEKACKAPKRSADIDEDELGPRPRRKKARWTEEENKVFFTQLGPYLERKENPPGNLIKEVLSALAGNRTHRTEAQIRTKVSNIITGKQLYVPKK